MGYWSKIRNIEEAIRDYVAGPIKRARQAGQKIYEAFAPAIQGLIRHILHAAQEVDDLTQSVFHASWKGRASYRGDHAPAPFLRWLKGITRRVCARHFECAPRAPSAQLEIEPVAKEEAGHTDEPVIQHVLAQLGASGDILRLRFMENLTVKELSTRLGVNRFVIRRRIERSLDLARRKLAHLQ